MQKLAQIITKIIDFVYSPFQNYVPKQIFRYAACGGGNMVLDWILYFLTYNFVVGHDLVTLHFSLFLFTTRRCSLPTSLPFALSSLSPCSRVFGLTSTSLSRNPPCTVPVSSRVM